MGRGFLEAQEEGVWASSVLSYDQTQVMVVWETVEERLYSKFKVMGINVFDGSS